MPSSAPVAPAEISASSTINMIAPVDWPLEAIYSISVYAELPHCPPDIRNFTGTDKLICITGSGPDRALRGSDSTQDHQWAKGAPHADPS